MKVIQLKKAKICLDCDSIFEASKDRRHCPICGSRQHVYLAYWIKPLGTNFKVEVKDVY